MANNQSPLDAHRELITQLAEDPTVSNYDIANQVPIKTSEKAIRRALLRWGVKRVKTSFEKPGFKQTNDEATIVSIPYHRTKVHTPDELMTERGLDPEEWEIVSMTINEWEGAPVKSEQKKGEERNRLYRQLKIHLRRKRNIQLVAPAQVSDFRRKKIKAPKVGTDGELVVFTGDQQAPFHNPDLHNRFCEWLHVNEPVKGILIGDTVDFPDISRHRLRPEGTATVQECINSGYSILRDYVEASPDTEWTKLCGNHDERIRNTLIDWTMELYGLKRAEVEGHDENSVLSIDHLLRLDELGIHYLDPAGSYEHAQVQISPYLAARHGWIATKGSGSSALKTLEHLGYSIIVGHTHRQSLVHKTTHDIQGSATTLAGVETGCMCRIEEGLGYAVAPDWQNGFATAHVWKDGKFKIDLATYVSEQLLWRDQRYE